MNPDLRVLFYWNTEKVSRGCYSDASKDVQDHPEWWATSDDGKPIITSVGPALNQSNPDLRTWWVDIASNVKHADGFFADSAGWPSLPGVSQERTADVALGKMKMLNQLRAVANGRPVIGNLLSTYPQIPDGNREFLPYVDGACAEHVGAFEQVIKTRTATEHSSEQVPSTGVDTYPKASSTINATRLAGLLTSMWDAAAVQNKTVLFRGWPGPVTQPIDRNGPTWPGPNDPTSKGLAAQADAALEYADWQTGLWLVVATDRTFLSYNWWYNQDSGVYPCPRGECAAPEGWYPVFGKSPGAPLGTAMRYFRNGTLVGPIGSSIDRFTTDPKASVYTREFEGVSVRVELEFLLAELTWKQA